MAKRYWAKRSFEYNGKELDRGQITELAGAKNDEKLVRLGYFGVVDSAFQKHAETFACAECGAEFIGFAERDAHGKKRHSGRALSPVQEDARQEREEKMLQEVAPLGPVS